MILILSVVPWLFPLHLHRGPSPSIKVNCNVFIVSAPSGSTELVHREDILRVNPIVSNRKYPSRLPSTVSSLPQHPCILCPSEDD